MTPIGHCLAGVGVFLVSGYSVKDIKDNKAVFAGFVLAATLPDTDLLVGMHRQATHSLVFCAVMPLFIAAGLWLTGIKLKTKMVLGLCAAGLSHLIIDWFSVDNNPPYGMQVLWPFSKDYFMSSVAVFPHAVRSSLKMIFSLHNFITFLVELFFGFLLCFTLTLLKHFFVKGSDEKKEPVFYS